jgi:hypothetical protein
MHWSDLPNWLSGVTVVVTLVVVWYARQTVREARRATAEEKKTVAKLEELLGVVGDLTASSRDTLKAAERTAELTAEARDAAQRNSQVALLRQLLRTVEEIQSASAHKAAAHLQDQGPIAEWDEEWRCPQQHDLAAALKGAAGTELSACRSLAAARGAINVSIDVPAIDSVLFGSPKESVIDIIQIIGRALRPHGEADTATIIVPALLPAIDAGEEGPGDGGRYEHVLRVVRALCAHDETLTAGLAAARAARVTDGETALPAQITLQAPAGTLAATLDALHVRIVDGTTSSWQDGYGHARAYHAANGHLLMPVSRTCCGGFRLGAWLTRQRVLRNSGQLTAERIGALDALGMTWNALDEAWMRA